jgi:8-oxo-dGTP pyrophosphatase MutT (NUDIX family)
MNIEQIIESLKDTKAKPIDDDMSFSVMVPLIEIDNELNIMFEVRSNSIRQPGEISFPGGQIETGESPEDAAVRETHEEIGIPEDKIRIISELDYASSKGGSFVYSYLGEITGVGAQDFQINESEVSKVFFVPLSFFLENEPEKYYMNYYPQADKNFPHHMVNNGANYNWGNIRYPVYFYKYSEYIIWGLTAKITYSFIKKLKKQNHM